MTFYNSTITKQSNLIWYFDYNSTISDSISLESIGRSLMASVFSTKDSVSAVEPTYAVDTCNQCIYLRSKEPATHQKYDNCK